MEQVSDAGSGRDTEELTMPSDPDAKAAILTEIRSRWGLVAEPLPLSIRQLALATGRRPSTVANVLRDLTTLGALQRLDNRVGEGGALRLTTHNGSGWTERKALFSLPATLWLPNLDLLRVCLSMAEDRSHTVGLLRALQAHGTGMEWHEVRALFRGDREAVACVRRAVISGAVTAAIVPDDVLVWQDWRLNLPPSLSLVRTILGDWVRQHRAIAAHKGENDGSVDTGSDRIELAVRLAEQRWTEAHHRADEVLQHMGAPLLPPRSRKGTAGDQTTRTRRAA